MVGRRKKKKRSEQQLKGKIKKKKRTHIHSTKHKHTSDAFREYKNNRNQNSVIITNNKICETLTVRTHRQTDKQAKKKKRTRKQHNT